MPCRQKGNRVLNSSAGQTRPCQDGAKIKKIINIGTPHTGSAKAFRTLREGFPRLHDFVDAWLEAARRHQRFAPEHLADDIRAFDSVYELLPTSGTTLTRAGVTYSAGDRKFWRGDQLPRIDAALRTQDTLQKTDQNQVYTIYSSLTPTEAAYTLDANDNIVDVEHLSGDGTVTAVSAQGWTIPQSRLPLSAPSPHSILPRHKETYRHLTNLLPSAGSGGT